MPTDVCDATMHTYQSCANYQTIHVPTMKTLIVYLADLIIKRHEM